MRWLRTALTSLPGAAVLVEDGVARVGVSSLAAGRRWASASSAASKAEPANVDASSSSPPSPSFSSARPKVHELRIYDVKPEFIVDFKKLSGDFIHLRTNHSKLLGYWFTEFGGINQAVHIWEYDSFAHRCSVRAALADDDDWQEKFISKVFKGVVKQDNVALALLPWSRIEDPRGEGGVYELCAHTLTGSESKWATKMQEMLMGKEESHQGDLLAAWKAQAGGVMNTVYHLWHYPDLDHRVQSSIDAALDPDYVLTKEELLPHCSHYWTKILLPAPWSPMK